MADPFAAYVQPEHEDGDPFAAHLAPAPHDPDDDVDTGPPTGAAARRFTPGAFDSEVSKLNAARAQLAPDGRSFLHRAADSVVHGVKAVAHVGSDVAHHPLDTLKDPAKRRELERGIDDMVTLGYGQKLAEHVTGDPLLSAEQESRDAAAAPDYRTAGNAVGAFTPGAASEIGKGAGKLVDLAVPAGVGGVAGNAARSVGAYEVAAPTTAALSANAEGDRLRAAREAATDPAGLVAAGIGGIGEGAAKRVLASEGAKAREMIERKGSGARVGVLTPGAGGVFDRELAGVPANDKGIGAAAKVSAQKVLADLAEQHRVETSRPFKVLKAQIDNAAAKLPPRDVTSLVTTMDNAVHDLDTAPFVRAQLREQLDVLRSRYTDPTTGVVALPERQLNGLRRTLARAAKVGTTDAPGEAEAPLRAAAFEAKKLVDQGPYEALNRLYAEGAKKLEGDRESLGLKAKRPKDAALDERKLKLTLLRERANTQTGGGDSDIAGFRAAHPDQARNLDLTDLARARAALGFHVAPAHGGLMARAGGGLAPLALGYGALTHPLATLG